MVDELHRGRDGIIREVVIKYCNSSEQKLSLTKGDAQDSTYPRYTERAVRRLIKIFSVEDGSLAEDLAEIAKNYELFKQAEDSLEDGDDITAQVVEKPRPGGRRAGPQGLCDQEDSAGRMLLSGTLQPDSSLSWKGEDGAVCEASYRGV